MHSLHSLTALTECTYNALTALTDCTSRRSAVPQTRDSPPPSAVARQHEATRLLCAAVSAGSADLGTALLVARGYGVNQTLLAVAGSRKFL